MNTNETWLMPVSKKTLSRVVTDKITEALANGQLKPGDYLPSEGQLAENLNVGKSSVREATKMLEAVGVVEIIKGRGCRIRTTIDSDALNPLAYQLILQSNTSHEKLVEFRRVIESTVSCLAVKTISKEEVSRLKNICLNMEENMSHDVNNLELDIELIYMPFIRRGELKETSLFKEAIWQMERDMAAGEKNGHIPRFLNRESSTSHYAKTLAMDRSRAM